MTACGIGAWEERPAERELVSAHPEGNGGRAPGPMPAQIFPIEPVDVERKARKVRSAAVSAPSRRAQRNEKGAPPPADEPELVPPETGEIPLESAAPAAEWIDPLAAEEVATPDLVPTAPSLAETGANAVTWLVVVSCSVVGAFMLWQRRRERRRRRRREAWTPIRCGGPRLIRPDWAYDPDRYDSDAFLQRWDSIALSISGEWSLLLAIAGQATPGVFPFSTWRRPVPRVPPPPLIRPIWRFVPLTTAPQLAKWCRIGLGIQVDPQQAAMVGGQLEWLFDMSDVSAEAAATPVVPDPIDEELTGRFHPVEFLPEQQPASNGGDEDIIAEPGGEKQAISMAAPVMPESHTPVAQSPAEEAGEMAWLTRIAPLLQAWEASGAPETEQALWEMSRRLSAHAEALPQAARTPWLDAVEALAERVAVHAPEASRGAWMAHWVDLRLARLGAMNGAWRLLELRALHEACAAHTAPEVVAARVRLLHAWAGALLGPAAKAKQAEAVALAASLASVQALHA